MGQFEEIFVHCSASDYGCAGVFNTWHIERGWSGIGYHFVIDNGYPFDGMREPWQYLVGSIEAGRRLDDDPWLEADEVGAHVYGFNGRSIGICLVGKYTFYREQVVSLYNLIGELQSRLDIPVTRVFGHCEAGELDPKYATAKSCPNQPMDTLRSFLLGGTSLDAYMQALDIHIDELKEHNG
jgi:N-acetylmuramoyl-L-alanine amidase